MGRAPCCDKANVKKGPWAPEEDARLKEFIEKYGTGGNWIALPQKAGLRRCGKSCRLRWLNYLRPNIKHGEFSDDEDRIICSLYASIGSRWSVIAAQLPGRTDNDIKNYWNTKLKKKLFTMLPSLQERPNLYPSLSFQPPLPPPSTHHHHHHHHITPPQQFFNSSSPLYSFNPNFMNVDNDNSPNSIFVHNDHNNVTDHVQVHVQSPATYQGFDDHTLDDQGMCNNGLMQECCYNNSMNMKEGMVMFGSNGSSSSTGCSSSEGGPFVSQMCQVIKQEDNYPITSLEHLKQDHFNNHEGQYDSQGFLIKNTVTIPLQNEDVEDVKTLNFSGYLFHDGEENKTTHYQKGMCSYYY